MPPEHLTRADVLDIANDLRDHIDAKLRDNRDEYSSRFDRIEDHLRQLNGSVARHEARIAEEGQKTRNLEKEVFDRPRQAPAPLIQPAAEVSQGRQAGLATLGLAVVFVTFRLLEFVGGHTLDRVKDMLAK